VLAGICDKMIRRHPHVFGDAAETPGWETLKAAERGKAEDRSALAGVALALPALKRAEKLQRRAARVGFDWPDASGPRAKIDEELAELAAAGTEAERHQRSATSSSRPSTSPATSTSTRKRPCAMPTAASNNASARSRP
jgi:ATP diphosphatase